MIHSSLPRSLEKFEVQSREAHDASSGGGNGTEVEIKKRGRVSKQKCFLQGKLDILQGAKIWDFDVIQF